MTGLSGKADVAGMKPNNERFAAYVDSCFHHQFTAWKLCHSSLRLPVPWRRDQQVGPNGVAIQGYSKAALTSLDPILPLQTKQG